MQAFYEDLSGRQYVNEIFNLSVDKLYDLLFTDSPFQRDFMEQRRFSGLLPPRLLALPSLRPCPRPAPPSPGLLGARAPSGLWVGYPSPCRRAPRGAGPRLRDPACRGRQLVTSHSHTDWLGTCCMKAHCASH